MLHIHRHMNPDKENKMAAPEPRLPPPDPEPDNPYPPAGPDPDRPDPDVIDPDLGEPMYLAHTWDSGLFLGPSFQIEYDQLGSVGFNPRTHSEI